MHCNSCKGGRNFRLDRFTDRLIEYQILLVQLTTVVLSEAMAAVERVDELNARLEPSQVILDTVACLADCSGGCHVVPQLPCTAHPYTLCHVSIQYSETATCLFSVQLDSVFAD